MIEYVIWATNPLTGERKPISDKVYNKKENDHRMDVARQNGWVNVTTQTINLNDDSCVFKSFIQAIN